MKVRHRAGTARARREAVILDTIERVLASATRDVDAVNVPEDELTTFCRQLAQATPRAAPDFEHDLLLRIQDVAARHAASTAPISQPAQRARRWWLTGAAATAALLLGLVVAGPVLGQIPPWRNPLKHVAVQEAATMTPLPAIVQPPPVGRRWEDTTQLQREAGFAPLLPGYLPPSCAPSERWYDPIGKAISQTFTCGLDIVEWSAQSGTALAPHVAPGAAQTVTVHGKPAIYIHGAWVGRADGTPTWQNNGLSTVIVEDGDLVVQISAHQPEDVVFRIANSLP